MIFRCPHCRKLLETDEVGKFLCPLCKKWSRVPESKKAVAVEEEEVLEVVEAPPERLAPRRRPAKQQQVEGEELEVVGEAEDDRPQRSKRRRRRRSSSGGESISDYVNVQLILLIVLAPLGLAIVALCFVAHPILGFTSLPAVGGWVWFLVIASEDGIGTALMVMFVPFYALYYASNNWDRVGIPFLLMVVGNIGMVVGQSMAKREGGRRMQAPAPIVRMLASASPATASRA